MKEKDQYVLKYFKIFISYHPFFVEKDGENKMKKIYVIFIMMLLVLSMFVSGCVTTDDTDGKNDDNGELDDDNDVENGLSMGTLQLWLTDAPGDLDIIHANVTISTIQVHKANSENNGQDDDENEDDDESENGDFVADANGEYEGTIHQLVEFTGSATGGEEPYNWSWDFGDDNTSEEQNPIHSYSTNGTYEVILTVTDNTSLTTTDTTSAIIGEPEDTNDEDDDSTAGWYTINDEAQTFDLIELMDDISDLLGEEDLEVGRYTQIRLTVESAMITINYSGDHEEHDLFIPSGNVKLIKAFMINEGETTSLTLDFDIYKSVHQTGNDRFIMRPTIKVIQN